MASINELLEELDQVNRQQNNDKPVPCLLFVPPSIQPDNLTFFNGVIFVHLVIFDNENKQVSYDRNIHYFGVKYIKNAINIFISTI